MDSQEKILKNEVRHEIEYLLKHNQHPPIHPDTDAVWVFSGPGTFLKALENNEQNFTRWMDRYRILYGLNIVKKVTAKKLKKSSGEITKQDILENGPLFIYNGTEEENKDLRAALNHELSILPSEKVIIVDQVKIDGTIQEIENTLDQIKSFPKELVGKQITNRIAIVSHAPHIARILRYFEEFKLFPETVTVEVFSLTPIHSEALYMHEEMEKIWQYFQKGDLSWNPIPAEE
jgi:hypothetical protein